MNKRLYTAAALLLALCLTVFCTACREDTTADDPINLPQPPVQDEPQPPVQDDPQPPVQDDPDAVYDTYVLDIPLAASAADKRADAESMRLYSDFLAGAEGVKAYDMQDNTEKTLVEMYPKIEIDLFALVDFGLDGRLEVVLRYRNTVLFCEDGKLYAYVIPYSRMYDLRYNGLCETDDGNSGKSYVIYNFCENDGLITQTIASE